MRNDIMEKHEMMSLEDSGQLRDKIRFFEQELLKNHHIDPNLYVEYNVKRGLRDSAGKGVLTGLTEISDVNGYNLINGRWTFILSGNQCTGYHQWSERKTFWI